MENNNEIFFFMYMDGPRILHLAAFAVLKEPTWAFSQKHTRPDFGKSSLFFGSGEVQIWLD